MLKRATIWRARELASLLRGTCGNVWLSPGRGGGSEDGFGGGICVVVHHINESCHLFSVDRIRYRDAAFIIT